ncbi:MAG: sulfotransferase [Acidimicrobiia bacterium]|nr:sulfotransferase [Acidimicrobiia bacterium]
MPAPSPTDVPALFLLGAPRSGTSLLYRALCLHPRAAWMSNWMRRFPTSPRLAALGRVARALPDRRRAVWFADGNAYVYGRSRRALERLFPQPVEGEPVFNSWGLPETLHTAPHPVAVQEALRILFRRILVWGGGDVVVNKRIANNLRVATLDAAFPRARFVELTRDGRAVAASLAKVDWWPESPLWWWGDRTPLAWAAEGRDPWEACAREWVEDVELLESSVAGIGTDRLLRLSYEELVDDPVDTLVRVATFGGLTPERSWVAELRELDYPNRNERWRADLDAGVVARIEAVQGAALRRHGYPVGEAETALGTGVSSGGC